MRWTPLLPGLPIAAALLLGPFPAGAIVVTPFCTNDIPPTWPCPAPVYDPDPTLLNANVGMAGALWEDFEDATLLPGVSVSNSGGTLTIPSGQPFQPWDGVETALFLGDTGDSVTFSIAGGADVVGIGLSDYETTIGHTLSVNGETPIVLIFPEIFFFDGFRNVYLRIDGEGEKVTSLTFELVGLEALAFDHLALLVPEPGALVLLACALAGAAALRTRVG